MTMPLTPILISIEGNIGAGKSTLLDKLRKDHPTWHFIPEPVGLWQTLTLPNGHSLLELFYEDTNRYCYTFQNCAVLSRAMAIQDAVDTWRADVAKGLASPTDCVFVTERCLETDHYVFAKMFSDNGTMNSIESQLYSRWYSYVKTHTPNLSYVVYVDTPPSICADRIKQRARSGEDAISSEYLHTLDMYQRKWLFDETNKIPVLTYKTWGDSLSSIQDINSFLPNSGLYEVD